MKAWSKAFWQNRLYIPYKRWAILGLLFVVLLNSLSCNATSLSSSWAHSSKEASTPTQLSFQNYVQFTDGLNKPQFFLPPTGGQASAKTQTELSPNSQQQAGFCSYAEQQQNSCDEKIENPLSTPPTIRLTPSANNIYYGKAVQPLPCADFICSLSTLRATRLMQRSIDKNVFSLTSAAVDNIRNRIYVIGRFSPYIAVLDGVAEEWQNTLDSSYPIEDIQKKIYFDPVSNYLYLLDLKNQQLKRIEIASGTMIGPIIFPEGEGIAAVDTQRGRLYLFSRKTPFFTIVDGKNLNRLATNNDLPSTIIDAVYHEGTDSLILLNSASEAEGEIILWDVKTSTLKTKLQFPKQPDTTLQTLAVDSNGMRFFVSSSKWIVILQQDGKVFKQLPLPQDIQFQAMAYDPSHDILAIAGIKCPHNALSCRGGQVYFFNPTSGSLIFHLDVGDALNGLIFNPANYHFYAFGENEPGLWSISADTINESYLIPLGDSIEQVVLSQQGKKIYWNSRLGDTYLIAYNVDDGTYEVLSGNRMPTSLRIIQDEQNIEHLFVLNAWDSRLNIFRTQPHTSLENAIDLGLPVNISSCLPDFAVDSEHGFVYAAFPQFRKIAVANWKNGTALGYIEISKEISNNLPSEGCNTQAQLQVLVNAQEQQLYVLLNQKQHHHLLIFNSLPPFSLIKDINLDNLDWKYIERSTHIELLFLDSEYNRLFIGPYAFNTKTLTITKEKLSRGQAVFAIDPQTNSYLAIGVEEGSERLSNAILALFRKSLSMRQSQLLASARPIRPGVAFDPQRRLLYVSDAVKAELQLFSVGNYR